MSLARNVMTVSSATLLSRVLAFFRDVGIAAVLGAGALSDAYFVALQIPNLFRRLLADGAVNSAFVPMWLRIGEEHGPHAARRFGERILGLALLVLGALALLGVLLAPLLVDLLAPGFSGGGERHGLAVIYVRLSVGYVVIAGAVAVAAAVLNAERRVTAAAYGAVVFNCVLLAAVVTVLIVRPDDLAAAGAFLSVAVVAAGLAQLVLVGGAMLRIPAAPRRPRLERAPETSRFLTLVVPGIIAGGIPQFKLIAGLMVASSAPGAVSWLYYANRLYEFPLGIVSVAISAVIVPLIAAGVRAKFDSAVRAAQSRAFEIALGIALPAAAAFAVIAQPIAGGLFQRGAFDAADTIAVAGALAAIAIGLPGHILEKVFGAIAFAHEDTRTPMLTALAGLAAAIAGSIVLFPHPAMSALPPPLGYRAGSAPRCSGWCWRDGAGSVSTATPGAGCRALRWRASRPPSSSPSCTISWSLIPGLTAGGAGRIALMLALVAAGLAVYLVLLCRSPASCASGTWRPQFAAGSDRAPCGIPPHHGMGPAASERGLPQWHSRNGSFPACSRPAICISAIISAPSSSSSSCRTTTTASIASSICTPSRSGRTRRNCRARSAR